MPLNNSSLPTSGYMWRSVPMEGAMSASSTAPTLRELTERLTTPGDAKYQVTEDSLLEVERLFMLWLLDMRENPEREMCQAPVLHGMSQRLKSFCYTCTRDKVRKIITRNLRTDPVVEEPTPPVETQSKKPVKKKRPQKKEPE